MAEIPSALGKLYSMLREADQLGLSRPARLRLIGVIGTLEDEELDRFRAAYEPNRPGDDPAVRVGEGNSRASDRMDQAHSAQWDVRHN
jgi:hypothetical protein